MALDLGTKTGYAVECSGAIISGVAKFEADRFSGGGMRGLRFRRWLDELFQSANIAEVHYEEVRRHKATDAAHVYGGLMMMLTAFCEEKGIPYQGEPVGAIKKFATGKGNADKHMMVAAVRAWGFDPADDNEADALAILHMVLASTPAVAPAKKKSSKGIDGKNLLM